MRIRSYKLLAFAAMMFVAAVAYTRPSQVTTTAPPHVVSLADQNGNKTLVNLEVINNEVVGVTQIGDDWARTALQPNSEQTSDALSCAEGAKLSCWEDPQPATSICMCVSASPQVIKVGPAQAVETTP